MAQSKWEKCIVRDKDIIHPDPSLYAGGNAPIRLLEGSMGSIPEAMSIVEYKWIKEDQSSGTTPAKGPHEHEFPEMFVYIGLDPNNPDDLGGEVEFWIGDGDDTEVLKTNTTSLIYVPPHVLHMPVFFKNIKRPFIFVAFGQNVGKPKVNRGFPLRGV